MTNLSEVCCAAGRADEAVDYCKRGLALFWGIGDRPDEAEALYYLGSALNSLGHREQARACWQEAWTIFAAIDSPRATELENLLRDD